MTITIRDVAEAAGVSTATVSRALRGLPNVDADTRAKVKAVALSMDYVISPSASRLASGRTGSIGVVTPQVAGWYFATVLSGIEAVLQQAGMDLLLISVGDEASPVSRNLVAPRLNRRVDGVITIALATQDAQLQSVLSLHLPTCLIGVAQAGVSTASIDDVVAARTATQHLINLGHRRIAVITGAPPGELFTAPHARYLGFTDLMREAGLAVDPALDARGYFTISGGENAMDKLLSQRERPTAVFAMSDEMAFGAMRSLRSHGLQPGRDISIVGIDGHDMSELLDLTTVAQPVQELGRIAAEALMFQIRSEDGQVPTHVQVPTQLIVRGSTAPPAN
jgi:DNA-binding LacI/PurR family transcriptional regulator